MATYSFESLWNNILMDPKFPYPEKRNDIVIALYHSFKKQEVMPNEITDYIEKYNLVINDEE